MENETRMQDFYAQFEEEVDAAIIVVDYLDEVLDDHTPEEIAKAQYVIVDDILYKRQRKG